MSFRLKLILAGTLVNLLLLACFVVSGLQIATANLNEQIELRARELGPALNAALGNLLAQRDYAAARDIVLETRQRAALDYAVLRDHAGAVIASEGWISSEPLPVPSAPGGQSLFRPDAVFHARIPIEVAGQPLGTLHFGFSQAFIASAQRAVIAQSSIIALGGLALTALSMSVIAWLLTRRLADLVRSSQAIERGDYAVRVDGRGADEFARLGASFNQMAATIEQRIKDLTAAEAKQRELGLALTLRAEDLATARDRAEAANRAKTEFLSKMSHELRTPLNGITGLSEMLLSTPLDERQARWVQAANSAANDLHEVIANVLEVAALEGSRPRLEESEFELEPAMQAALAQARAAARAKNLAFDLHCDARLPRRVRADARRIGLAVRSLADNAVKFTERGAVSVRLKSAASTAANRHVVRVRFEVADTGIGMDPAQAHRFFDPFEQADNSNSRRFQGAGLGLTIARKWIETLGGKLAFSSEQGKGSLFWFELDLAHAAG